MHQVATGFWKQGITSEPEVSIIGIEHLMSNLTVLPPSGFDNWDDTDLTDGTNNFTLVNWGYGEDSYTKPTYTLGRLVGKYGGFAGGGSQAFGGGWSYAGGLVFDFYTYVEMRVTAGGEHLTAASALIQTIINGTGVIRLDLRTGTGPTVGLSLRVTPIGGGPDVDSAVHTITSGVDQKLGYRVEEGVGEYTITIQVNEVDTPVSLTIPEPYATITGGQFVLPTGIGVSDGPENLDVEIISFRLVGA